MPTKFFRFFTPVRLVVAAGRVCGCAGRARNAAHAEHRRMNDLQSRNEAMEGPLRPNFALRYMCANRRAWWKCLPLPFYTAISPGSSKEAAESRCNKLQTGLQLVTACQPARERHKVSASA